MSDRPGEKTEQPTPRRLEEAWNKGQFARSAEIQTVAVLAAAGMALMFSGREIWRTLVMTQTSILGHLFEFDLNLDTLRAYTVNGLLVVAKCLWPLMVAPVVGGLLAGGVQNRFRTSPEALGVQWERLNPVSGLKRIFSLRSAVPTGLGLLKLGVILALCYGEVKSIMSDPIFSTVVDLQRIGGFMGASALKILWRVVFALAVVAAIDYAYQLWQTRQDLMMTKEEVKEEMKNQESNPQVKAKMRRRRPKSQRQMLLDVPQADVVVTNPTHIAVALRYDRKTMKAPRIVAKGIRLNALRIREVAQQHQVPILENKPLARMMFKYGKVGGEIPAQLYAAVAEVLAWVYRVNRYRYYVEQNQTT